MRHKGSGGTRLLNKGGPGAPPRVLSKAHQALGAPSQTPAAPTGGGGRTRAATLPTPWGREGQAQAFIKGNLKPARGNRLVHPCCFCLDPPRGRGPRSPPGQECYQHDPGAPTLKALMGGGVGGGGWEGGRRGCRENRIRRSQQKVNGSFPQRSPKQVLREAQLPKGKTSWEPVSPFPKSIGEQQHAGKCSLA